jgi:hypothetical protein
LDVGPFFFSSIFPFRLVFVLLMKLGKVSPFKNSTFFHLKQKGIENAVP